MRFGWVRSAELVRVDASVLSVWGIQPASPLLPAGRGSAERLVQSLNDQLEIERAAFPWAIQRLRFSPGVDRFRGHQWCTEPGQDQFASEMTELTRFAAPSWRPGDSLRAQARLMILTGLVWPGLHPEK